MTATTAPGARRRCRTATVPAALGLLALAGCGAPQSTVRPPEPAAATASPTQSAPTDAGSGASPTVPDGAAGRYDGDPAVVALRDYLREQALAINAGTADPAAVPAFTATLTEQRRSWALPLLQDNLGDRMPGPYPVGVLASSRTGDDRVQLDLCLQDRGWQVSASTGEVVNAAHFQTGTAVVLRSGERWLVDDVVVDGGECGADDVVQERF